MSIDTEFEALSKRDYDYEEEIRIYWSISEIGGFAGKVIDIKLKVESDFYSSFTKTEIIYLIKFFDPTKKSQWVNEYDIAFKYKPKEE